MIRPDDWLNRKEAAIYLTRIGCPISPKTLANLASNGNAGKGPPFIRIRWSAVMYRRSDLEEWAIAAMVKVA